MPGSSGALDFLRGWDKDIMTKYLFVYGTLLEGQPNHFFLKDAEKIGAGICKGLLLVPRNCKYPMFRHGDKDVQGEVFECSGVVLTRLDMLELPYGYVREIHNVQVGDVEFKSWVYVYQGEIDGGKFEEVPNGDWRGYAASEQCRNDGGL